MQEETQAAVLRGRRRVGQARTPRPRGWSPPREHRSGGVHPRRHRSRRPHLREGSIGRFGRRFLPGVRPHRARPPGAPLAGDAAHVLRARREARLLPVVGVPDRAQPGPVPDEPGPVRGRRDARRRARLRPRRRSSSARATRASATAASGGSRPASWIRWRRSSCPRSATASATTSASSSSASKTATRSSTTTTGCSCGNPWELPRHEDAQTVRFGGRVELRHDADGRLRVDWVDTRTVIGLPYDSFIVGHRTDTVNTLRLWAARATRDFDLQFFNEGDYRRAVEEKIDTENISKVLYPNDHSDEGKALRLKQQYFFVACSIADIIRRYKRKHRDFDAFPDKVAIQLNDTHPAIAVAELMRVLVDEERLDWDAAWAITAAHASATRTTRCCPRRSSAGRWRCSSGCCRATCRSSTRSTSASCARCSTRWPGDAERLRAHVDHRGGAGASRCAWPTWRRSARTASTAWRSCTPSWSRAELLRDFYELWPERFNNKTNGVTPRRWLLLRQPAPHAAADLEPHRRRAGSTATCRGCSALAAFADDDAFLDALCARQAGEQARPAPRWSQARTGVDAARRRDVRRRRSSASTSTSASCWRACRSSRTTCALKRDPDADARAAHLHLRGQGRARLRDGQAAHPAASTTSPPSSTPTRRCAAGCAVAFVPELRRVARAVDHPGGRPVAADLDRRQGGLGHQQHEVRAERRAHDRHARRRQRRDPRRGRRRELLPVRPDTPTRWRRCARAGYDPRAFIDRSPALDARRSTSSSPASSASATAIASSRSSTTCATTTPTWCAPTSTPTSRARGARGRRLPRPARLGAPRAVQHRGRQPLLERPHHPPVRDRDLEHQGGEGRRASRPRDRLASPSENCGSTGGRARNRASGSGPSGDVWYIDANAPWHGAGRRTGDRMGKIAGMSASPGFAKSKVAIACAAIAWVALAPRRALACGASASGAGGVSACSLAEHQEFPPTQMARGSRLCVQRHGHSVRRLRGRIRRRRPAYRTTAASSKPVTWLSSRSTTWSRRDGPSKSASDPSSAGASARAIANRRSNLDFSRQPARRGASSMPPARCPSWR